MEEQGCKLRKSNEFIQSLFDKGYNLCFKFFQNQLKTGLSRGYYEENRG
ncbi:hypothetical protein HMPREF9074_08262 [Capnocytophaga sp. oral taxon 329 str. F0087]|nr:hypothetical protein HMPREF9074_08262 [Capnocytophaga sp. oral taxon 329 str. F0087]